MCEFDTLFHEETGYIVRCTSCNHYQVAFGTFCLTLDEADYTRLQKRVAEACTTIVETTPCRAKHFSLNTPHAGVQILMNAIELGQFYEMLDKADTEAKTMAMLRYFNNE